ncbi:MAG: hypothetical protein LUD16_07160 [Lachnospiraceae bacterium]|nr:hypothetical protein [Lachnospiraceae bacterium]
MKIYSFSQWVFFFYIYCFLGWLWESAYVSIKEKHLVNRGFLKGPLLPIYGSGALCVLIVTLPFRDSIPLMCLSGMAAATVLEYATGAAMEKLFHVRYWDYSDKFMNLNGHICLASALCWGVMTVLVVEVLQVYVEKLVLYFDEGVVEAVVLIITPFVTADAVTSFRAAIRLRDLLIQWERVSEEMRKLAERKQELELAIAERKSEMESVFTERKQEIETVFTERKQELEDAIKSAGEKANETLAMGVQGVSDRLVALGELPGKIAALQELTDMLAAVQEKAARLAGENELLRRMSARSIRGLLKRNPKAVSFMNKEAFDDVRKSVAKKEDRKSGAGGKKR